MKKLYTGIMLAALASLLCFLPAVAQDDVMTIGGADADYGFVMPERPAVSFPHTAHMDLDMINGECLPCHHSGFEDGKFIEGDPTPCKDCHEEKAGEPKLEIAYHTMCIGCHQEAKKGPITCGECHVQKDFFGVPLGGGEAK